MQIHDPTNNENLSLDNPDEHGNKRENLSFMDGDDRSIVESNIFDMGGNNELDQMILLGF